jgi:hypothetical protein
MDALSSVAIDVSTHSMLHRRKLPGFFERSACGPSDVWTARSPPLRTISRHSRKKSRLGCQVLPIKT